MFIHFVIYAFLGFCIEVIYQTIVQKRFVNRGFLNGAYCPIYGFGAVLLIDVLANNLKNPLKLYIVAVLVTSIIELITGYILERIFNLKWWDYSLEKFNLKGYICLKFSLLWGVLALFLLYVVNPKIDFLLHHLSKKTIILIDIIVISIMLIDLIFSILKIIDIKKDREKILQINEDLKIVSDRLGKRLSDKTIKFEKKYSRLLRAYPKLKELIKKRK